MRVESAETSAVARRPSANEKELAERRHEVNTYFCWCFGGKSYVYVCDYV
jgi:hypothetical protein